MDNKAFFMKIYELEFETTQRVIKAVPDAKGDYTPNPISKTLKELTWSVACSEKVWGAIATTGIDMQHPMWQREMPATVAEMAAIHASDHAESVAALNAVSDADWEAMTPGWMGLMPRYEIAWGMLLDTIHHRGQLSTYLRGAGEVVPSIYGPTAETNQ